MFNESLRLVMDLRGDISYHLSHTDYRIDLKEADLFDTYGSGIVSHCKLMKSLIDMDYKRYQYYIDMGMVEHALKAFNNLCCYKKELDELNYWLTKFFGHNISTFIENNGLN